MALPPQECPYSDPAWGNDPRATAGDKPGTVCMCMCLCVCVAGGL